MNQFHISQAHEKIGLNGNLPFWISMIKESQKVLKPDKQKKIIDFGCGEGKFLHLFDLMDELESGLGLELDEKLIQTANDNNDNANISYQLLTEGSDIHVKNYDAAYSQEAIYTIKDLDKHAKNMLNVLKPGGFYFATMGSHLENPLWSKRRQIIREEEKYYAYDYSIDEVADTFYNAGFEVGIKRLPVEYFLVYHPKVTKEFSNSLYDLVKTTYEYKMLFSFWKPTNKKNS